MQELALHDCVIVPGFGAFLASRRRAAYSPESVLPSSVEFFFNSAVCNDDGLLASSFARRNRLSFEEARLVLAEESESLRMAIDSYGEATIGRVGVLRRGEEGTITFHPLRSAQAYAEAIGMPPIRLAGITSDDETKKQEGEKSGKTARKFRTDRSFTVPDAWQADHTERTAICLHSPCSSQGPADSSLSQRNEKGICNKARTRSQDKNHF